MMSCVIVQHSAVKYRYCTVLYRTVRYRTGPFRTVLYRTVLYRILYCIGYCTVLYRILYCTGLLPSNTLTWGLLYMAREPAIQSRLQAEIDRVTGPGGRLPRLADRDAMPYTEAVIMEIQRCANVVPHGLHHMSAKYVRSLFAYILSAMRLCIAQVKGGFLSALHDVPTRAREAAYPPYTM
jgi:hypothetical protein